MRPDARRWFAPNYKTFFPQQPTNNKLSTVTEGANVRTLTHDGAGNISADDRVGTVYNYRYNNRGRLDRLTIGSTVTADYVYDGLERLAIRVTQNMTPAGTTHYVYDLQGHLIAEANDTGQILREYVWLDEMPLAVVADVDTTLPQLWFVHADHLDRPVRMTGGTQAVVWDAAYRPFGVAVSITGSASNNLRFPGQYFLLESGLHYNWHRHDDPTTGRYLQPDPLEFIDGPSLYAYALSAPTQLVDPEGRFVPVLIGIGAGLLLEAAADYVESSCSCGAGSSVMQYVAAGVTGGVVGDYFSPLSYPRSGVGGSASSGVTSRLSSGLSRITPGMGRSLWAPTLKNPLSATASFGKFVARWSGVGSALYAGYNIYRIGQCFAR